ncbi:MAG: NAD-dependent deacylase [Desulfobacteraceae bacterium]
MYKKAGEAIKAASRCVAFTGAGISVESGIPPFRGKGGLWNRYDPETFNIQYFLEHTDESWDAIRTIFYDLFGRVRPNPAHLALAKLEREGLIKAVITQNVDNLHYDAGSETVHEFHGSLKRLACLKCKGTVMIGEVDLSVVPPLCSGCGAYLKPDVIFFGEPIPEPAGSAAFREAEICDCMLLIGTTGEVAPANMIPRIAKQNRATIIEINPVKSFYTDSVTDIFIEEKAGPAMEKIVNRI